MIDAEIHVSGRIDPGRNRQNLEVLALEQAVNA